MSISGTSPNTADDTNLPSTFPQIGLSTPQSAAIFFLEILLRQGKVRYPFQEADNGRNKCPAKEHVDYTPTWTVEVEFVNTNTA